MKIGKSQADAIGDFAVAVALHASEMKAWRAHMARVKEDEANGVTGIDKHWPLKRPNAHPLVESTINERDEADYEIVDDGPSPEDVLAARKVQLFGEVTRAEHAAIAAVVPLAKSRLFVLQENEIRARDAKVAAVALQAREQRVADLQNQRRGLFASMAAAAAAAVGFRKKDDDAVAAIADAMDNRHIADAVNASRSDDEQQHLAGQKENRRRIAAIERAAAQAHADIEDLTLETIDAFKIPDFTKEA